MKCEHGNEVTVEITTVSDICWDDGIYFVDEDGIIQHYGSTQEDNYLTITGCPDCKTIKVKLY
jgi:hypothetical protein